MDTKPTVSKKKAEKVPGIGDMIRAGLKAGQTNEQCLKDVKAKFADAKTTVASVSWYRNDMRSKGEKVLTAREAKAKQDKAAAKDAGKAA
jgi:hypothetical protein